MTTIWGAERWDMQYRGIGNTSLPIGATEEIMSLETAQWRSRAPLWFQSTGANTGTWNDSQATFDVEITAAVTAGLKYWAFLRYELAGVYTYADGYYGLQYYQASAVKNLINWCSILGVNTCGATGAYSSQVSAIVAEFSQSNYQKVLTNRPLLYIIWSASALAANWGGSLSNFAAFVTALRAATVAAGMGTPYIVVQNGLDLTVKTGIGADAITAYNGPGAGALIEPWTTYEPTIEAYWASMAALGGDMIPIAMMGWDQRPRQIRPPNYQLKNPYFNVNQYVVAPTAAQITAHLTAGVAFINANPTQCPAAAGLIYSWNEFSENGFPLCPTIGDPTGLRCAAAGMALIGN